jgi:hypothetical protein
MADPTIATKSILRVADGRGFVVQERDDARQRYVVTAAHCLPKIPCAPAIWNKREEVYQNVLGRLDGETSVWAECVFVDPIADIAVLSKPRHDRDLRKHRAYHALIDPFVPLKISDAATAETHSPAYLVALDGQLVDCTVRHSGTHLWVEAVRAGIVDGMSGSPVLDRAGMAIGIVSRSKGTREGRSPRLVAHLPGWLLITLGAAGTLATPGRDTYAYRRQSAAEIYRQLQETGQDASFLKDPAQDEVA